MRPDVVWFGEMLPAGILEEAWARARSCAVMLVAGTSGMVYPAADLPRIAVEAGAAVIDVNPELRLPTIRRVFPAAGCGRPPAPLPASRRRPGKAQYTPAAWDSGRTGQDESGEARSRLVHSRHTFPKYSQSRSWESGGCQLAAGCEESSPARIRNRESFAPTVPPQIAPRIAPAPMR